MYKIYLVGFMGSGKSAVGRRLSYLLKMPYYDMDKEIVKRQKMSIPEIFEQHGEAYFRNLETEFLLNFRKESCIISTGGGVATLDRNIKIMRNNGLVLFLDATFEDIWIRIKNDKNRPIVQRSTKEELQLLFNTRRRSYKKAAHITIRTENRHLRQITEYAGFQVNRLKGE
ncbi:MULTISPECIES: shikimate kinase [Psychrobacillus]|uniref:Shikimate kinase n=1 Tax=Psychrobacillus faecigallinarum TaxID=2762235 RepID=A0ABR8R7X6_9BACI|nr:MULTISPECIES: shikimate kinase [Psychrobacillus]MBD7943894.1 shikimate kinase [Psychrobacillus faecigallinarum]QEY19401.1 shikimate kinase [Psychrobacillus sp. AK 1817]QGM29894.1 shikimate kinase [Bacillus sp. N3536]